MGRRGIEFVVLELVWEGGRERREEVGVGLLLWLCVFPRLWRDRASMMGAACAWFWHRLLKVRYLCPWRKRERWVELGRVSAHMGRYISTF